MSQSRFVSATFGGLSVASNGSSGEVITKEYVDDIFAAQAVALSAGTGINIVAGTIEVKPTQALSELTLTGHGAFVDATFTGAVIVPTPLTQTSATNKAYVDGQKYTIGPGLTLTNNEITTSTTQPTLVSVGTLTGLTVSGPSTFVNGTFTGNVVIPDPVAATNAATKAYVDSQKYTIGSGLTLGGDNTLSLSASQPTIVSLGTSLTNVDVAGGLTVAGFFNLGIQYEAPLSGDNITVGSSILILDSETALATLTLTLPIAPPDGQLFRVSSATDVTALTFVNVTFPTGGVIAGLTANTPVSMIFSMDAAAWFRI